MGAWDQDLAVGLRVLVTVVLLHILLGDKDDRHVTTRTVHLLSQACVQIKRQKQPYTMIVSIMRFEYQWGVYTYIIDTANPISIVTFVERLVNDRVTL